MASINYRLIAATLASALLVAAVGVGHSLQADPVASDADGAEGGGFRGLDSPLERELQREAALQTDLQIIAHSMRVKNEIAAGLIDGRISVAEAGSMLRDLYARRPRHLAVRVPEGASAEAHHARYMVRWAQGQLSHRPDALHAADRLSVLLREHLAGLPTAAGNAVHAGRGDRKR